MKGPLAFLRGLIEAHNLSRFNQMTLKMEIYDRKSKSLAFCSVFFLFIKSELIKLQLWIKTLAEKKVILKIIAVFIIAFIFGI